MSPKKRSSSRPPSPGRTGRSCERGTSSRCRPQSWPRPRRQSPGCASPCRRPRPRRYRPHPHGARIDMRATFRRSLRTGSGAVLLARRRRVRRPAPIVVLCDISGSMSRYSRILLHFAHAPRPRPRTGVLLRLRHPAHQPHPTASRPRCGRGRSSGRARKWRTGAEAPESGSASTDSTGSGPAGYAARARWCCSSPTGSTATPAKGSGPQVERLRKSCRRLVWLNPLLRYEGFRTEGGGHPRPPAPRGRVPAGAQPRKPGGPRAAALTAPVARPSGGGRGGGRRAGGRRRDLRARRPFFRSAPRIARAMGAASMTPSLSVALQHVYPRRLLSRLVHHATRLRFPPLQQWLIRTVVRRYEVDLSDAVESDPRSWPTFNAFFTRALRPEARPLPAEPDAVAAPSDGTVQHAGDLAGAGLVQAKSLTYSIRIPPRRRPGSRLRPRRRRRSHHLPRSPRLPPGPPPHRRDPYVPGPPPR